MSLNKKKICLIIAILCLLGILFIWGVYYLRSTQRWESLDITHLIYPYGWQLSASDHISGQVTSGPGLTLQSGTYTIEWEIDTDADNTVVLTTDNNANLSPAKFIVHAGEHQGECTFTLLESSDNLQFLIFFDAGSYLNIGTISLRGKKCSDRFWLITFILLALCAVFLLFSMDLIRTKQDLFCLIILILSALLSTLPAFRLSVSLGHDGSVHIRRLQALVSALMQRQFPVRVSGSLFNGYGSLFAVFYPALILYPAAFMICCHASLTFAFQSTIFIISLLSTATMYITGKKLFQSKTSGVISTILYLFAPYRLTDVFTRVALGEAAAMAFMPLFVLELTECFFRNKKKWPQLALTAALLINTHLLTALICAGITGILFILALPQLIAEKRISSISLAGLFTLGLSISTLAPMLTYYRQGIDVSNMLTSMSENALSIGNLLGIAEVNSYYWLPSSRSVGFVLILSNVFLPAFRKMDSMYFKTALRFAISGIIFGFMTTSLFPWKLLSQATGNAVDIFQFPYRFLVFSDTLLALSGGFACAQLLQYFFSKNDSICTVFRPVFVLCILIISVMLSWPIFTRTWSDPKQYSSTNHTVELFTPPDYLLTGTSVDNLNTQPLIGNHLTVSNYSKFGTQISCDIYAEIDALLTLPLFLFDGYSAAINGHTIPVWTGENNRIMLLVKGGTRGLLEVKFTGKTIWRMMDVISLICFIIVLSLIYRNDLRQSFNRLHSVIFPHGV